MGLSDGIDALVGDWLTLEQAAEQLEADVAKVRQLLREHKLIGVRRRGEVRIPAAFLHDVTVLKGLPGTLTVLADAGYSDDEALRWLFTSDESLPGSPVQALTENRGTEVKRRAQALAF
jgi:excisionase family DNA binding protein